MKLQQLRFLLAVVDNDLNITTAAETLYTSQPGVSKQLRLLEEELGLQIFVRRGKRIDALTSAGERVVQHARAVFQEVDQINSLADELRGSTSGSLTLATTQTQARYVLPAAIGRFRERFADVDLHLHQGTSEQIAQMLDERSIDFAIVSGSSKPFPDIITLPLYQWDRVIVVPAAHPLAQAESALTLQQLAKYPLVTYLFSERPESSLMSAFTDAGMEPRIGFTARDADVIKTYVRNGFGVGVLAGMAIESGVDDDLHVIDAAGLFPRLTTWLGFSRDLLLKQYHCEFIQLLAPHLSEKKLQTICRTPQSEDYREWLQDVQLPLLGSGSSDATGSYQAMP